MKSEEIKAFLLHLGHNMWCEWLPEELMNEKSIGNPKHVPDWKLACDEALWRKTTDMLIARGMNMVLVDVGEALIYPSHPELAIPGSWSPEKMRNEMRRLKARGLEPIPKLNFSCTHDGWLKDYHRMVSTPDYYKVVDDVIGDAIEVFDHPRFIHLGFDEERVEWQRDNNYFVSRQGELWWHDFLFTIEKVEKLGARAWIWSDKVWHHKDEFLRRCPKSVLQSNWYYEQTFAPDEKSTLYPMVHAYDWLEKAGFEQVPCCSNCGQWNTLKTNTADTARYVKPIIAASRLKGMMTAPWTSTTAPFLGWIKEAVDMLAEARSILERAD